MSNIYLDLVQQGKNQWWRYVLIIPAIIVFWMTAGSIPLVALMFISAFQGKLDFLAADPLSSLDPLASYVASLLSFIPLLIGVLLAVRFGHGRRLMTLISPSGKIRWRHVGLGFCLWFLLSALGTGLEAFLYPGRYQFSLDLLRFIPFLFASLILIPIQSGTEELFFRGYLLQGMGLLVRNPIVLSIINGVLFWLPHLGNPEIEVDFWLLSAIYMSLGIFLAAITLRSQGLELALGVHISNNLLATIIASYPQGALPTSAVFTVTLLDPVYGLVSLLASAFIFYFAVFGVFPAMFGHK